MSSSSRQGQPAYIIPSRRTTKRWTNSSSNKQPRAPTPTTALHAPQYVVVNNPANTTQTQQRKTGVVYYPVGVTNNTAFGTNSPTREWETENENEQSDRSTGSKGSRQRTVVHPHSSSSGYTPPRRTFAEYIWQYAQRLRKKGKRVRFVPQPTEIPPEEEPSADYSNSSTSAQFGSSTSSMGSSASKHTHNTSSQPSSSRSRSRRQQQQPPVVVTAPYSSAPRSTTAAQQPAYTYTYTYPQYQYPTSTYHAAGGPESAYYLGTETFPALHALGGMGPRGAAGGERKSRKSRGKGAATQQQQGEYSQYGSGGVNYQPQGLRHQHRGTTGVGGRYVLAQDGMYYWYPDASDGGGGGGTSSSSAGGKRSREPSVGRGERGSGREKKLRRAKGVDDMRGRSLRGGSHHHHHHHAGPAAAHAYGGGWVSVGA